MQNIQSIKPVGSILLIVLLTSCAVNRSLNLSIDSSQKAALIESPFRTAKGVADELNKQFKYRSLYLFDLDSILTANKRDTIYLQENYDYICFGCPADYVAMFIDSSLITYKLKIPDKKYKENHTVLSKYLEDNDGYLYYDILELRNQIRHVEKWNQNPEKFGTDECFDGGHTLDTIIFPSGKIESMYMRCWVPKDFRKKL
ncbi:MAG: hypothetical protein IPJ16_08900 [Bacteroidales bacterium]|nr:hypothetical protein [Bacteroidales bacterium]